MAIANKIEKKVPNRKLKSKTKDKRFSYGKENFLLEK